MYIDPLLPEWLPDVTLYGLQLGEQQFDISFWREGETTQFEVLRGDAPAVRLRAAR
jgi:hypothetical protein